MKAKYHIRFLFATGFDACDLAAPQRVPSCLPQVGAALCRPSPALSSRHPEACRPQAGDARDLSAFPILLLFRGRTFRADTSALPIASLLPACPPCTGNFNRSGRAFVVAELRCASHPPYREAASRLLRLPALGLPPLSDRTGTQWRNRGSVFFADSQHCQGSRRIRSVAIASCHVVGESV